MRVPFQAGSGQARLTLSYPDWPEGNVAPAIFETPILDRSWPSTLAAYAWWLGLGITLLLGALWIRIRKKDLLVR